MKNETESKITIKIEKGLRDKFHQFSKSKGVSLSGLMRMLVIEEMKKEGVK